MAIRDGLTMDLDGAKTEAVVRRGKVKYVAAPAQPAPRRVLKIGLALIVALVLFAAIYYFYTHRDVPDRLTLSVDKSAFSAGEEITVTVFLQNDGPKEHSYVLSTDQTFGWEIQNSTGGIVAESASNATAEVRQITVGPGRSLRLGEFSWNQTALVHEGDNETWTQVPGGDYIIRAYFKASADIAAEKRITIG